MTKIIKLLMEITNNIHDKLIETSSSFDLNLSDKQLHFIIIGIMGIFIFACTQYVFRKLAKYSITAISFIYTFTVLVVIVFAIEIEQKITHRGNMEFADILAGLYGFLYLFLIYLLIRLVIYFIKKLITAIKHG
ncbi:MAG: hypothetical protein AB6733_21255 [Clostridiaceae bacterium]